MATPNFKKVNTKGYYLVYDFTTDDDFYGMNEERPRTPEEMDGIKDFIAGFANGVNKDFDKAGWANDSCDLPEVVVSESKTDALVSEEEHPFCQLEVVKSIIMRNGYKSHYNLDYDITLVDGWDIVSLSEMKTPEEVVNKVLNNILNMCKCYGLHFNMGERDFEEQKDDIKERINNVLSKAMEECEYICHECAEDRIVPKGKFASGEEYYEFEFPFNDERTKRECFK